MEGVAGFRDGWRFAKDMGMILGDSAERIAWQTMGDDQQSPLLNKVSASFFKWNGTTAVVNATRALGVSFGIRYLIRSAEVGDTQALEGLGVTSDDVVAWDQEGRPTWQAGVDTPANALASKVGAAINQFVYEASSMPSKLQSPGWFNNPWMKAFWMIKRYMYAYGEGIIGGMWRQSGRQWTRGQGLRAEQRAFLAAAPFMAFAVTAIPLAAAGMELREWLRPYYSGRPGKHGVDDYGGVLGYGKHAFSRSGGFGPFEAILSVRQQSEWGYSPIGSMSPVFGKVEMLTDFGRDGSLSGAEALNKTRKLLPIFSQSSEAWNAVAGVLR
jgi:hypothetical protein